jgi:hypothetical protein
MNMETAVRSKLEDLKTLLVSATEAVEEYEQMPSEKAKAQVMKRISLALAASGQL